MRPIRRSRTRSVAAGGELLVAGGELPAAGKASGQYLAVVLLAIFVVIAFCAVMLHVNRMVFGAAPQGAVAAVMPLSCKLTLALAVIPLIAVGVYVPARLQELLHAAANAMGG